MLSEFRNTSDALFFLAFVQDGQKTKYCFETGLENKSHLHENLSQGLLVAHITAAFIC